jgi:ubiquinone/menaquinone biosynthesis C-methylase UbiE
MEGGIARWYAKITRDGREYEQVAEMLAPLVPTGGSFLEVAPGPGYHTIELASRCEKCHAFGLDTSETFVRIASENARRAGVDVKWCVGNASSMPYPDESFDLVVCQAAFKNFTKPVEALAEMLRVLKPGGTAVVIDLRRDATMADIDDEIRPMNLGAINRAWTRLTFRHVLLKNAYVDSEMREMAARAGLSECDVRRTNIGMEVWMRG